MPGIQELLVIGVAALVVVGPDRLPGLARDAARLLARLREETSRATDELRTAAQLDDVGEDLRGFAQELRQTVDHPASTSR